jgi:hypothetical protein
MPFEIFHTFQTLIIHTWVQTPLYDELHPKG